MATRAHANKKIKVSQTHPSAVFPKKERGTNVCFEITLIGRTENRAEDIFGDVNLFTTGIQISPPEDYYIEITADKLLYRSGYMLASPIIINPGEKGELIIPLYKFKENDDIELPFVAVQLVVKPALYVFMSKIKGIRKNKSPQAYNVNDDEYGGNIIYTPISDKKAVYRPGVRRPVSNTPTNHMF